VVVLLERRRVNVQAHSCLIAASHRGQLA